MSSAFWKKLFCVGVMCLVFATTFAQPAHAQQDCEETVAPFDIGGNKNTQD
jgi:hypothetical protein